MDFKSSKSENNTEPTKQKILVSAVNLFSSKGYSETTVRDIASAVGITSGSIYGHFSSKEEILLCMLDDYAQHTKNMYHSLDLMSILRKNPTAEGITTCIMSSALPLTENNYYLRLFHLVHQEQHRIALFGDFLLVRFKEVREYVGRIIDVLKELNLISNDVNVDYWGVITFSILYTLSNCMAINIRQKSSGYATTDLAAILCYMFDAMLKTNKPSNGGG
jgi:AcrR family transcriptional regulator